MLTKQQLILKIFLFFQDKISFVYLAIFCRDFRYPIVFSYSWSCEIFSTISKSRNLSQRLFGISVRDEGSIILLNFDLTLSVALKNRGQ